jgi:hypothetical protein
MTPKDRIKKAVENYITKNDPNRPTRKNQKPEKELEREAMKWLRANGFDCTVVESKSTFSKQKNRFISQSAAPGTCDIVGNDPTGRAVFIELKAKGRIGTLRENQRNFLERKIRTGCFAVVVDSVESLQQFYNVWTSYDPSLRAHYLESLLPERKEPAGVTSDWP